MFSKCILHIGTEKTGTTTLQHFLSSNRSALRHVGFVFPSALGAPGNRHIATYAMNDDRSDDGRRRLGIATAADLERHRRKVEKLLHEEATAADASVLLLSSEHCHSRLVHDAEVLRLHSLLARVSRKISVVVYLRPQHELAISRYSTVLRVGYSREPVLPRVHADMTYYNYEHLLNRWARVFDKANVTPRVFARNELLHSDICADFLALCGIDGRSFTRTPDSNRGLSGEAQAFLERMNPHVPGAQRGKLVRMLDNIGTAPGARPSRTEADRFMAIFAASNEAVRRRWFRERDRLFDVDFSTYPRDPFVPRLSEAEFEHVVALWQERQNNAQAKAAPPKQAARTAAVRDE